MPPARPPHDLPAPALPEGAAPLRVGVDLVQVAAIANSLAQFGMRFMARLFTPHEIAAAGGAVGQAGAARALPAPPGVVPPLAPPPAPPCAAHLAAHLAVHFAAKEAVIKALGLAEAGIGWREIELVQPAGCRPRLALHGRTAAIACALGVRGWAVSLSRQRGHACALVVALSSSD